MTENAEPIKQFREFAKRSTRIIKTYLPDRQPLITERDEDAELHCTIILVMLARAYGETDEWALGGLENHDRTQLAIDLINRANAEGLA